MLGVVVRVVVLCCVLKSKNGTRKTLKQHTYVRALGFGGGKGTMTARREVVRKGTRER